MSRRRSDGSSVSSYSSGNSRSSSRSSSTSSSRSGSSKKSRISQVSHSNIKSDHWSVSFMKWTTGAPLGKPLSLRRTKVREIEDDWGYDDGATVYSDSSYTQYAWVTPKWDDSISEIASRSSSRSAGQLRREHRSRGPPRFAPSPAMHQPPPLHHPHPSPPPPPPAFMPPPPMCDDDQGYDDYPPEPMFHQHPPPPPMGAPGDGAGFINLGASGGGGSRKYEPW